MALNTKTTVTRIAACGAPLTRKCELKRWQSTSSSSDPTAAEWNAAKPYDQIPGARSLPIIGTMWAAIGTD